MNSTAKTIIKLIMLLLLGLMLSAQLNADGDILVSLRFYEGIKSGDTSKSSVVSSYYLEPLFVGNLVTETGLDKEKNELKRVFNLKDLKLMTSAGWSWRKNQPEKRFQVIILNGHEFVVKLSLRSVKDTFKAEVIEKGNPSKSLLDTEILLPQKKSAVFGFEDSVKKPFFLSFHREKDKSVIRDNVLSLEAVQRPVLKKRFSPVYPKKALDSGIEGRVILEILLNPKGYVDNITVVTGHPLLRKAAADAVKKWIYNPYIL
ncbi:MAG: energy transducer TonB, partial [bacterium]|nr:energy transducer TonB [bacterium]